MGVGLAKRRTTSCDLRLIRLTLQLSADPAAVWTSAAAEPVTPLPPGGGEGVPHGGCGRGVPRGRPLPGGRVLGDHSEDGSEAQPGRSAGVLGWLHL